MLQNSPQMCFHETQPIFFCNLQIYSVFWLFCCYTVFVWLKLIKNFSHSNYVNLLCRSTNVFCHARLFKRANKYLGHRFSPGVWCGKVFAAVLCTVSSLLDNLASEGGIKITLSISHTIIMNFPFNQTEMYFVEGLFERLSDCFRSVAILVLSFCSYNNWPVGGSATEWRNICWNCN